MVTLRRRQPEARRRGTVLIVTMIVVFALGSLVLALGRTARVEATASANTAALLQADAIARGAEQYVLALLTDQLGSLDDLQESDFAAVPVGTGWFWVLRPDYGDDDLPRFGLVDESAKLPLNTATVSMLKNLPGMNDELAASIYDWRDGDDTSTESGAESSVYLAKSPPYRAKNGDYETVEELLLVHGMTRELLYGSLQQSDAGRLATEQYRVMGLFPYVSAWNVQRNIAADGTRRVNLNDEDRETLRRLLRDKLGETRGGEVAALLGPPNLTDVFELASRTRMTVDELRLVEDYVTTAGGRRQRGLINVNAAPREVLLCLEGVDESQVDQLLAARPAAVDAYPGTIAWVYQTLDQAAIGLGRQITGRGRQFSADILAVAGNGRAFRRVRIVVDASRSTLRIVYRRDITDRGWPLDAAVLTSIRNGQGVGSWWGTGSRGRAW